jgi:fibronectin type 3 domain-containing protein
VNFTATAQQAHSVALSWNPSTSTVSGYNIYRSSVSGGGYEKLNSLLVGTLAFTDSTVQSGGTYYYVTTAVDAGGVESTFSNEVSAAIP